MFENQIMQVAKKVISGETLKDWEALTYLDNQYKIAEWQLTGVLI